MQSVTLLEGGQRRVYLDVGHFYWPLTVYNWSLA